MGRVYNARHRQRHGPEPEGAVLAKDTMQALGMILGDVDASAHDFEETRKTLPEPAHFGARAVLAHWQEKQAAGGLVFGKDLPSRELSTALRNLMIYEPLDGGRDFRVRVAGSALIRRFGRDIKGLLLSELFDGAMFAHQRDEMNVLTQDRKPVSIDVSLRSGRRNGLKFEVLYLPILASENGPAWPMVGIFYHDWVG